MTHKAQVEVSKKAWLVGERCSAAQAWHVSQPGEKCYPPKKERGTSCETEIYQSGGMNLDDVSSSIIAILVGGFNPFEKHYIVKLEIFPK